MGNINFLVIASFLPLYQCAIADPEPEPRVRVCDLPTWELPFPRGEAPTAVPPSRSPFRYPWHIMLAPLLAYLGSDLFPPLFF